jgi:hypothetical protein
MRATINFDIDLGKVEETMAALVSQEAATLHITANILDNLGHGSLLPEITEALDLLQETSSQLEQYKSMLISFEQAKYQTLAPQSPAAHATPDTDTVPEAEDSGPLVGLGDLVRRLRSADTEAKSLNKFDDFIGRMQEAAQAADEEGPSEKLVPEG